MTLANSIKYSILFSSLLSVIFAGYASVSVQAMCPIKTLDVKKVQGQVMEMGSDQQDPIALPNTKVELMWLGNPDVLITTVETDDKGFFEINDIKKGKYRLVVYFIVNGKAVAPKYDVILKVEKSNVSKSNQHIYISLAFDCSENIVKLVKKKL